MKILSSAERKALKARAHKLDPVVIVSDAGLSGGVLAEIERSLDSHELIKLRLNQPRDAREALLAEICRRTGASPVQHIGKVLVIYLESPGLHKPSAGRYS